MLILDTNVVSALRRPERAPQVAAWLAQQQEDQLYLSVVTLGEIERGIARQDKLDPSFATDLPAWLARTEQIFGDRLLPVDARVARIWGELSARLGHSGADLLIAATALRHDAVVATRNVDDFTPTGCLITNPFD